jgi:molybdopterin synthase catalytic subunit
VDQPLDGDDWFGLTESELPIGAAYDWAVRPQCGAVVLFSGTIRDHADGRPGVEHLTYEAYEEQAVPRFAEIGAELRRRWPDTGRVVLLHRLGQLGIGESSVIAVVSAPHRAQAFEAARFAIDALKEAQDFAAEAAEYRETIKKGSERIAEMRDQLKYFDGELESIDGIAYIASLTEGQAVEIIGRRVSDHSGGTQG